MLDDDDDDDHDVANMFAQPPFLIKPRLFPSQDCLAALSF